jgi:hypothetical protein
MSAGPEGFGGLVHDGQDAEEAKAPGDEDPVGEVHGYPFCLSESFSSSVSGKAKGRSRGQTTLFT